MTILQPGKLCANEKEVLQYPFLYLRRHIIECNLRGVTYKKTNQENIAKALLEIAEEFGDEKANEIILEFGLETMFWFEDPKKKKRWSDKDFKRR